MPDLNDFGGIEPGLDAVGYQMPAYLFRQMLREMLATIFPRWDVAELLCNPKAALSFVDAVRNRLNCRSIPECVILRTLRDCTAPKE